MPTWGTPTDREVEGVVNELIKHHPETVTAAESLYGSSRSNSNAFKQAIRHAMSEGGIRRVDGRKWGLDEAISGVFVEPAETRIESNIQKGPLNVSVEAVVTGVWNIVLHPEPLVKSSLFLSPGAHMKVLEVSEVKGAKWTRVILDDGQEGWLEGEPQQNRIGSDGRIAHFSYADTRAFFITHDEPNPRIGFVLHWAQVVNETATSGGTLEQIIFSTADLGDLTLPLEMVRKITIDRSRSVPVELQTQNKTYRGDFRKYHPTIVAKNLLVTTRPFISVRDYRNEIDLEEVEHAVLDATDAPTI